MTEKSILEQALLQVQTLEEAVKQNAKGILASTMKQELNDLLKESEEENDELDLDGDDSVDSKEEVADDMSEQPVADDEEGEDEDSENVDDLDNDDPSKDIDSMDSEVEDDEFSMGDEEEFGEPSFDDEEDVMDMTGASDDEVLKIFKAMKPEDGIVVKKDGDNVNVDLGDDEYIIKLDSEDEEEVAEEEDMDDESMEYPELGEETIYEIELDDEEVEMSEEESDDEEVEMSEEESDDEEVEMETTEAARTYGNDVRTPANQGKKYKAGRHEMNEEVETLKKQNSEYKKALVLFKDKLNEVAVFNANLAYATRLFTEHSTTKQEKLNILKRFDSVSTMNESKNLFSTIKSELGTKTTVTESVVEKISNTPSSSSSQEVLAEAKAYENPQFSRMKELMRKVK
jgi:hypothetical protein